MKIKQKYYKLGNPIYREHYIIHPIMRRSILYDIYECRRCEAYETTEFLALVLHLRSDCEFRYKFFHTSIKSVSKVKVPENEPITHSNQDGCHLTIRYNNLELKDDPSKVTCKFCLKKLENMGEFEHFAITVMNTEEVMI